MELPNLNYPHPGSAFPPRGVAREAALCADAYYASNYFSMRQLASFAHQINHIHALKPRSVLEIGIGNGFVSTYLRRAGIEVVTVDLNCELSPDICCELKDLPNHLSRSFDLVSCCEVLEHLPWHEFEPSISIIRNYSSSLFLALPYGRHVVGAGGLLRVPTNHMFGLWLPLLLPRRRLPEEHFWELSSSSQTSKRRVTNVLKAHYGSVTHGVFQLNPRHHYFRCQADV